MGEAAPEAAAAAGLLSLAGDQGVEAAINHDHKGGCTHQRVTCQLSPSYLIFFIFFASSVIVKLH